MKCRAVQPMLDEYAAGTLPSPERERIREHCDSCEACSSSLRMITGLRTAHEKEWTPSAEYWSGLLPRIHARIDTKSVKRTPAWVIRFAIPSAAVVVLLFSVTWFGQRGLNGVSGPSGTFSAIPADELEDFLDRQAVVGLQESSIPDQSVFADDVTTLSEIVRTDNITTYSDVDNISDIDALTGPDAENVAAYLESGRTSTK